MVFKVFCVIEKIISYGFIFGGGYDIVINDNVNSNINFYVNFGYLYFVLSGV